MDDLALARALHVLAVVVWIGGVAMATSVAIPGVRRGDFGSDRLRAFHAIEHRFVWQARSAVLLVGATGLYMVARLDLWDRFRSLDFWWMHAMVCVWAIFAFVLFIGEPLILHRRLPRWVAQDPETAFTRLHRAHVVLLTLGLITVFGAVAGSHGWSIF
ncbi:hypothetical protein ACFO8O_05180 [Hephaestia sp. GCM10023244]|uniref:hypothetical protein n=1 Tax=unclassified Hephaestia TaxID=2631281 RepID=UPI002077036A|nr:hypothetical protein [Hephaestia sp. MAHUQ-44]MCM8730359.1 hypothetical protein [Hephaestia sp. MAHUQ-44]